MTYEPEKDSRSRVFKWFIRIVIVVAIIHIVIAYFLISSA